MIKNGKITPVDPYLFNLAQPISIPPKKTVNIQHHTSNFQPHTSNVQRPTSHSTIMCANHKNPRHQRSPYYIIQHHTSDPPPIGGQASHRRNGVPSTPNLKPKTQNPIPIAIGTKPKTQNINRFFITPI